MKLFTDKPNLVKLTLQDQSGSAERWVTGKTLDEAIGIVEVAFGGPTEPVVPGKKRRRRTKKEIEASKEPEADKNERAWPQGDTQVPEL